MKVSDIIMFVFLVLLVVTMIWGLVIIIGMVSKDIGTMIDWNNNIASDNGTVISTGATISIWKDGSGKMHAGFMLRDKQYELQVIE